MKHAVLLPTSVVLLLIYSSFLLPIDAGFDRYKLVVQVVIGEQRGQGVKWVIIWHNKKNLCYSIVEILFCFCRKQVKVVTLLKILECLNKVETARDKLFVNLSLMTNNYSSCFLCDFGFKIILFSHFFTAE